MGIFGFKSQKKNIEINTPFADVHCHLLPGVDDGAPNMETTMQMLDIAYKDGIRTICFTPHVRQPWLERDPREVTKAFEEVKSNASYKYPDIKLYLGAEIYYTRSLMEDTPEKLKTMNETDYLLVEFSTRVSYSDLEDAIQRLISDGFIPIIAHIERFRCLWEDDYMDKIRHLRQMGAYLQMNADTIASLYENKKFKKKADTLLENYKIQFISTDAHDIEYRVPRMREAYQYIADLTCEEYADDICYHNAGKMLDGQLLE